MAHPAIHTADELLRVEIPGKLVELVRGRLVVREPPGFLHGRVAMNLALAIGRYVAEHDLGQVLAAETGFQIARDPDTVRAPDVAFVRGERVPDPLPAGYAALAPDLVVEVLSPNDRPGEVLGKVADWLSGGSQLVWVVDPDRRSARIYRADGSMLTIAEAGVLEGEDVLPGFAIPLNAVL